MGTQQGNVRSRRKQKTEYTNVRRSDSDTSFSSASQLLSCRLTAAATKAKIPKLLVGKRKLLFHFVRLHPLPQRP